MALQDYVIENLRWKVGALLLAVFTWFSIQFAIWKGFHDLRSQRVPRQPVQVLTLPGDSRSFTITPPTVEIVIRATPSGLQNLTKQGLQVFVNLTDAPATKGVVREVLVFSPSDVEIIHTEPKAVYVESSGGLELNITISVINP